MDKPIYLEFAVLELSKSMMFERYYGKVQHYFGEKSIQLHYIDNDSFLLSVYANDIIKDLKNLENRLDFSYLNENLEKFSNKNKKVLRKFQLESPKNIFHGDFVCLRGKLCAFKCGNTSKNKLKGF